MQYDVLVIGGGLSGIAAAIRLALGGKRVALCERNSRLGGMNTWYEREGMVLDTGLHALTNYVPETQRKAPLNQVLRQLRIRRDALSLCPQRQSRILFPGTTLTLNNDFDAFTAQIEALFPQDAQGFRKLCEEILQTGYAGTPQTPRSTNDVLTQYLSSERLRDMLRFPVMYYGCPTPEDMDFGAYATMFRSVLMEGFARPQGGMREFLGVLENRLREEGAEIRLNSPVEAILYDESGTALKGVRLRSGELMEAPQVISTIGARETAAGLCARCESLEGGLQGLPESPGLCARGGSLEGGLQGLPESPGLCARGESLEAGPQGLPESPGLCAQGGSLEGGLQGLPESPGLCARGESLENKPPALPESPGLCARGESLEAGQMAFLEAIFLLPKPPVEYGFRDAILFVNRTERFRYAPPAPNTPPESMLVCAPGNYLGTDGTEARFLRLSTIADAHEWLDLPQETYRPKKLALAEQLRDFLAQYAPDMARDLRLVDVFTPRTILRWTGHANGAIYGAPQKYPTGDCGLPGITLAGTDQGLLGITGAMLSGILAGNQLLKL